MGKLLYGSWGKLFTARCPDSGISLQKLPDGVPSEAAFQKVPYAFGHGALQEKMCVLQEPDVSRTPEPEREMLFFSIVFPEPSTTKLSIVSSGKGEIFTGFSSAIRAGNERWIWSWELIN